MTEEEDIELIDKFIEGKLSEAEAEGVKQRLQNDKEFASLYNDLKYLVEGTRVAGRNELLESLKKADSELVDSKSPQWYWITGIAAAVVIVATIFIFMNKDGVTKSVNVALVKEYFTPYPNVVVPVVRGGADDSTQRAAAFRHYELGEFADALKGLKNLDAPDQNDLFYMGVSALAMNDYKPAIAYLQDYMKSGDSFDTQVKWYLALAHLGNEEVEVSRGYLADLAGGDSKYSKQASELLAKMK